MAHKHIPWGTKIKEVSVGECPECEKMSLDLLVKPINVEYLSCTECGSEFTVEYVRGYWDGRNKD